jgi:guanine deaminase
MNPRYSSLRGPALTFVDDPFLVGVEKAMRYESDAIVAMAGGKITHFGPADEVRLNYRPALQSSQPAKTR